MSMRLRFPIQQERAETAVIALVDEIAGDEAPENEEGAEAVQQAKQKGLVRF